MGVCEGYTVSVCTGAEANVVLRRQACSRNVCARIDALEAPQEELPTLTFPVSVGCRACVVQDAHVLFAASGNDAEQVGSGERYGISRCLVKFCRIMRFLLASLCMPDSWDLLELGGQILA